MTRHRNMHAKAAREQRRQARDKQKAKLAEQQLAVMDFRRSRRAGGMKLGKFVKKWRGKRAQVVRTRSAPKGFLR